MKKKQAKKTYKSFDPIEQAKQNMSRKEQRLREIAAPKSRKTLWRDISHLISGSSQISNIINEKFDKRYSSEERLAARQELKDKYGGFIKKQEEGEVPKSIRSIKSIVVNIAKSLAALAKTIKQSNDQIIKSIQNNSSLIKDLSNKMEKPEVKLKSGKNDVSYKDIEPETFAIDDKEYLYYHGAPEGRQVYEKSKKGTAGKIARREIQSQYTKKKDLIPAFNDDTNTALSDIERMITEESAIRKSEIQELIAKLDKQSKTSGLFDVNDSDQRAILEKMLTDALEQVIKDNPNLLKCSGASGISVPKINTNEAKAAEEVGEKGLEKGAVRAAEKSVAKGAESAATSSAGRKSIGKILAKVGTKDLIKKLPFIGVAAGIGFGVSRLMDGDFVGAGLEMASGATSMLPVAGTVAGVGLDAAIAARDVGMWGDKDKLEPTEKSSSPTTNEQSITPDWDKLGYPEYKGTAMHKDDKGNWVTMDNKIKATDPKIIKALDLQANKQSQTPTNNIIDGNKEIKESMDLSWMNSNKTNEKPVEKQQAPIVNNITNNTNIPKDTDMQIHNRENTFNRLLAQDFDHPSTYSSLTMG